MTTLDRILQDRSEASVASVANVEIVLDKGLILFAINRVGPVTRAWVLELDLVRKVH